MMMATRKGTRLLPCRWMFNSTHLSTKLFRRTLSSNTNIVTSALIKGDFNVKNFKKTRFPYLLPHKGHLLQQNNSLKRHYPFCIQGRCYHSLLVSNDNYTSMQMLNCEKKCLFRQSDYLLLNHNTKRMLSMAWLDSLAVTQAGWFKALAESSLVEALMGGMQTVHDSLHLPWWGTFILCTILMRGVFTFPFSVYQHYIMAKVENLRPEMDELIKELKKETAYAVKKFGWDQNHARYMFNRSARNIWKELVIRENCHPFKASLIMWIQIPIWIAMTVSIRNMASMMPHQDTAAQILFMELSTGGFGWIPNLTEVDHSWILPVAMGITNLIITEINVLSRTQEGSKVQKVATNLFRFISVAIVPIAAMVPSCITLYWTTSSACALAQNLAMMHPSIRQRLGVPWSPSQKENPYQHLWEQLQKRLATKNKENDG